MKKKCSLNGRFDFGKCEKYERDVNDTDVNLIDGKLHLLTQSESGDSTSIRIIRFPSTKRIVSLFDYGLQTFECFKDGFRADICENEMKRHKINALWKLDSTEIKGEN